MTDRGSGRVLIIAGSDSGGGAGIQGDIKTISALRGYSTTAITALTAQNTQGVHGIHEVPTDFITKQIRVVMDDIGADAIKTGMLHNAQVIEAVTATIEQYTKGIPLVLDPVMFAKGGAALLEENAVSVLKQKLIPLATLVTPNIPEAEYLSGTTIKTIDDMLAAAKTIRQMGCKSVLIKGGHIEGETLTDVLLYDGGHELMSDTRIDSTHTHGTGCAMASAIATGLAQKITMLDAVKRARAYVRKSIEQAPQIGNGHGPLGHNHTVNSFKN